MLTTGNDFIGDNEYVFMRALAALPNGGTINIGSGLYNLGNSIIIPPGAYEITGLGAFITVSSTTSALIVSGIVLFQDIHFSMDT